MVTAIQTSTRRRETLPKETLVSVGSLGMDVINSHGLGRKFIGELIDARFRSGGDGLDNSTRNKKVVKTGIRVTTRRKGRGRLNDTDGRVTKEGGDGFQVIIKTLRVLGVKTGAVVEDGSTKEAEDMLLKNLEEETNKKQLTTFCRKTNIYILFLYIGGWICMYMMITNNA